MPHSIVHLIAEWSPFDAAAHLREVVRHQVQAGERVAIIILSTNPAAQEEIHNLGATCVFVHSRWQLDPFALRECAVQLRSMLPRVVHFWGSRAAEFASLARWAIPESRLIATLAAEPMQATPWLNRWLGNNFDALDHLVVDYATRPGNKTTVITPGVCLPTTSGVTREDLLSELNLSADAQLITIAGPLIRSQLIDEAIWNFELVRTLHEKACLVILGDGPDLHRLERYARLMSEPAVIRFVSEKGVRTIFQLNSSGPFVTFFQHSDVYWQPGRSTSIPTALLAAQAFGIPAVANDVTAHAQVIVHGENGFLVPTDKRAVWTRHTVAQLENASQREQFGNAARSVIAEKYSLPAMLQAYHRLFGER